MACFLFIGSFLAPCFQRSDIRRKPASPSPLPGRALLAIALLGACMAGMAQSCTCDSTPSPARPAAKPEAVPPPSPPPSADISLGDARAAWTRRGLLVTGPADAPHHPVFELFTAGEFRKQPYELFPGNRLLAYFSWNTGQQFRVFINSGSRKGEHQLAAPAGAGFAPLLELELQRAPAPGLPPVFSSYANLIALPLPFFLGLYDVHSGLALDSPWDRSATPLAVAFSSDDRRLYAANSRTGEAMAWSLPSSPQAGPLWRFAVRSDLEVTAKDWLDAAASGAAGAQPEWRVSMAEISGAGLLVVSSFRLMAGDNPPGVYRVYMLEPKTGQPRWAWPPGGVVSASRVEFGLDARAKRMRIRQLPDGNPVLLHLHNGLPVEPPAVGDPIVLEIPFHGNQNRVVSADGSTAMEWTASTDSRIFRLTLRARDNNGAEEIAWNQDIHSAAGQPLMAVSGDGRLTAFIGSLRPGDRDRLIIGQ
ncbi:MAG: hypothetical protein GMKNLPBB_01152 [Myxococcota bacterium]|nr:hypothetical protein [Myxococcota bacterium]